MKAVIALPDTDYYLWQALVQATAMEKWDRQYLIYTGLRGGGSTRLKKLMDSGVLGAVTVWDDPRPSTPKDEYHPAMKPWLVARWLESNPEQEHQPFLLLDPDAVPTGAKRLPTRRKPGTVYGTDTDSYTGPRYLKEKGVFTRLCEIAGVQPGIAEEYRGIGAQYLFEGQDALYFDKVSEASVEMWEYLKDHPSDVQVWCAEMYAMQLVMLARGWEPQIAPSMSMTWANNPAEEWRTHGFFHDAGIIEEDGENFAKTTYQVSPWNKDLSHVSPDSASYSYVKLIEETAQKHPNLIW